VTEENLEAQLDAFTDPVKPESITGNMLYELILKSGYLLTDKIESKGKYYSVNNGELAVALDEMNPAMVEEIISSRPQKVITLDKLFTGNDQLKTNTVLQMKDAGIDFKTV
jgi:adenine-specific DNA-methyltransferase